MSNGIGRLMLQVTGQRRLWTADDYSRDLRQAEWGSGSFCKSSNRGRAGARWRGHRAWRSTLLENGRATMGNVHDQAIWHEDQVGRCVWRRRQQLDAHVQWRDPKQHHWRKILRSPSGIDQAIRGTKDTNCRRKPIGEARSERSLRWERLDAEIPAVATIPMRRRRGD